MKELQGADREALELRLRELIAAHGDGSRIAFPAAAWIVSARKG
jgi:hypothetical protein